MGLGLLCWQTIGYQCVTGSILAQDVSYSRRGTKKRLDLGPVGRDTGGAGVGWGGDLQ